MSVVDFIELAVKALRDENQQITADSVKRWLEEHGYPSLPKDEIAQLLPAFGAGSDQESDS